MEVNLSEKVYDKRQTQDTELDNYKMCMEEYHKFSDEFVLGR